MSSSIIKKRVITAVLICAMAALFWSVCAGEVNAASKKAFYRPIKVVEKYTTPDGSTSTFTTKSTYYKNGLLKQDTYNGKSKTVYTYDKSGYAKSEKEYSDDGKLSYEYALKIKKGVPVSGTFYSYDNGKKIKTTTYKYTYKKGLLMKSVVTSLISGEKNTYEYKYYKNGARKQYKSKYFSVTYDKKGNATKEVYKGSEGNTETTTYKNKYNKKGYLSERKSKYVGEYEDGSYTVDTTAKYKYTYYKYGMPKKVTITYTTKDPDGQTRKSVTEYTYKYKKYMVEKKLWKFMD